MAKGNIDPAFQAAPVLGGTSYNPIEFARRHNMQKFQIQRQKEEEQARSTAKGLNDLMIDLKGWEDQQGFQEIMGDNQKILDGFLELSQKGLNIVSPRSTQEIMAYKKIQDAHQQVMQKVDTWGRNKTVYDIILAARKEDEKLDPEDQKIDWDTTQKNLQTQLKGGILDRNMTYDKVVVMNPTMGNVDKFVDANKEYITKVAVDPVTYKPDPALQSQQKQDMGKLFDRMDPSNMRALEREQARMAKNSPDSDIGIMPKKDFFTTYYTDKNFVKKTKPNQPKTDTGSGTTFGVKYKPSERQNFRNYTTYHPTLKWPTQNIPVDNVMVWKPNGEKVRPTEKTLQLQYTGYDENTDQATFITESNYYGGGQLGKGDQIAIQMEDLPPEFKDIEILIDGKKVKIKDVQRGNNNVGKNSVLKNTKPKWNPATGKFE